MPMLGNKKNGGIDRRHSFILRFASPMPLRRPTARQFTRFGQHREPDLRRYGLSLGGQPYADSRRGLVPQSQRPKPVVYKRFCKSAGGAGSWLRVMFDVTKEDAHHAPRQA
jgi:hypothetical protein